MGYDGEGIVHILHCENCGAYIEYQISLDRRLKMKLYKRICRYCGEEFMSGSATGQVCGNQECQEKYDQDKRIRKRELERQRPRDRKAYYQQQKQKKQKKSTSLLEDVRRAEEMGLSYGQWKALYG